MLNLFVARSVWSVLRDTNAYLRHRETYEKMHNRVHLLGKHECIFCQKRRNSNDYLDL